MRFTSGPHRASGQGSRHTQRSRSILVSWNTTSCPPTFYHSFPVPHSSCACPKACGVVLKSGFSRYLVVCSLCFLLRAGSPSPCACCCVGTLWLTIPSGSVVGVTSHSIPVPNIRCCWWGRYPPCHLLTRPARRAKIGGKSPQSARKSGPNHPLCIELDQVLLAALLQTESGLKLPQKSPKNAGFWS